MRKLALLALLTAGACGQTPPSTPPPLDRFYFPTGLALAKLGNGDTALLVASSNFDLQYDTALGGTVIAVDVDATLAQGGANPSGPLRPVIPAGAEGAKKIGSFSGELALVNEAT